MNQEERLEHYLIENRAVNPLEAWVELGIYRLSAVIYTLKKKGMKIETVRIGVFNKFGESCNVAEYRYGGQNAIG
jgi:hypothetical protein